MPSAAIITFGLGTEYDSAQYLLTNGLGVGAAAATPSPWTDAPPCTNTFSDAAACGGTWADATPCVTTWTDEAC